MLLIVTDGQGNAQTVAVKAQEIVVDYSGSITTTNQSQQLLAANSLRSGWIMQNQGDNPMQVNEIGQDAQVTASFLVAPKGGIFPPENFPLTTAQVNIAGTAGDTYTVREW